MAEAAARPDAWEPVLSALEADLAASERLLGGPPVGGPPVGGPPVGGPPAGGHDAGRPARAGLPPAVVRWAPPPGLGPLPEPLAARARALEATPRDLAARLAAARSNAAGHLAALRAVPSARQGAPVYLDVTG
ncbi:hypothetical protein ACFFG1_20640 [Sinomonas atrocyanea]|uniref:hypothetical protein n=1 Tax=Sinomonas atrocyanea TaxID=37927 RepID=UPI0035E92757